MENEIKVNEYVRMIDGLIAKIVTRDKDGHFVLDRYYAGGRYLTEIEVKNDIVKHSSNLIDLIQWGDYVNGYKVGFVDGDEVHIDAGNEHHRFVSKKEEDIKTIVTKEMMESISYKVKE